MNKLTCFYNFRNKFVLALFVGCFIVSGLCVEAQASKEPNEPAKSDVFLKFVDAMEEDVKCSKALKELCDTADVGVIYTYNHYKAIRPATDSNEPYEITKARNLLRGLSSIAWKAMNDEFDEKERFAILEQLVRLEDLVLKDGSAGIGNVTIGNAVSRLTSGLIFQTVAESDISDLDRIWAFTQQRIAKEHYSVEMLRNIIENEIGGQSLNETDSKYNVLTKKIKEKYPELVEEYKDKKIVDLLRKSALLSFSSKSKNQVSLNTLVEMDIESFAADFFITRMVEIYANMSPVFQQLHSKYKPSKNRQKFISEFKEVFVQKTSMFEKKILGNTTTERQIERMVRDMCGPIRDDLRDKTLLKLVYYQYSTMSEDDGLFDGDRLKDMGR